MNGFLQPHELRQIQIDHGALIDGPDGCNTTMHWTEVTGMPDEYDNYPTEVEMAEVVRCHASPVSNHNVSVRAVQHQRTNDQQTGDLVILLKPDVDLSNKRKLWFEFSGLGNFTPEAKPPIAAWSHDVLHPSGQRFVQEIYCRPKR